MVSGNQIHAGSLKYAFGDTTESILLLKEPKHGPFLALFAFSTEISMFCENLEMGVTLAKQGVRGSSGAQRIAFCE